MSLGNILEVWRHSRNGRVVLRDMGQHSTVGARFYRRNSNTAYDVTVVASLEAARVGLEKWGYVLDLAATRKAKDYEAKKPRKPS